MLGWRGPLGRRAGGRLAGALRWGRAPVWLWVVSFGVLLASMAVAAVAVRAPAVLRKPFVDDQPLQRDQVPLNPAIRAEILEILEIAGRAPLGPGRLTQVIRPWKNPRLVVFFIDLVPRPEGEPWVQLDLSIAVGIHWINVHFVGELELQGGRFARLAPQELVVSGWAIGEPGADLVALANAELDRLCAKDSELNANLSRIARLSVRGGKFWLDAASRPAAD